MPLTPEQAQDVLTQVVPIFRNERDGRLAKIDAYLLGQHDGPYKPREAGTEYARLVKRATSNYLPLVVDVVAQSLFVEGYRSARALEDAAPWATWQANGLDGRQSAVHRAALSYGSAYVTVLPGDTAPVIRGVSPRKMLAVYQDPAEDDWPAYALRVDREKDGKLKLRLYDDSAVHTLTAGSDGSNAELTGVQEHGLGVCPVVRFSDGLDLDGRARGQVEPLIVLQDRLDQTVFDLLMVQTFASWKVRTATGVDLPEGQDDANNTVARMKLDASRMLIAEGADTKFGSLDETPMGGFIEAIELAVRQIATVSQVPPHHLLGQMVNVSAEALAAAEAGLMRKVEGLQHTFGEAWEQTLRLAAVASGDLDAAADTSAQVRWRDTGSRSLAQTADALGKISQMLGVPGEGLWDRLPGVTQQDAERWRLLIARSDPMTDLLASLDRQASPVLEPDEAKKRADTFGVLIRSGATQESAAQLAGLTGIEFIEGAVPAGLRLPQAEADELEA